MYGGEDKCTHGFGGKSEGKRQLGRSSRRSAGHTKMDHQEIAGKAVDSFDLAQDREKWRAFLKAMINFRVP